MPSLSYEHGVSVTPLLGQTIGDNLGRTVARHPDREALVIRSQNQRLTYSQLWKEVTECARGILALGVQKGDRVGIWAPNRYEWVVVQYATARIGAILVNVNPAYQEPELEYVLQQAGISVLIHAERFRNTDYEVIVQRVRPRCVFLRHVVQLEKDWTELLNQSRHVTMGELETREAQLHFDDPINIQYTSGTTGFPKGAMLTHHNLLNNAYSVGALLGYSELDRVCVPVPFYHCFGMVLGNLACTAFGACIVVPSEAFQARAALETVDGEKCTSLYGVPTMFRTILEDPDYDRFNVSTLRTGIMAGAPCPIELMQEVMVKLHMPEIVIGYGMTETSPISTLSLRNDPMEKRVSSVGKVIPHVEISVRDTENRVVPRGTAGEFCTRGHSVMRGYWNNDEATHKCIDEAGWMHSGDLAVMEEDSYVRIVGRLKDMIIRGGENIYPAEIEAVLHAHPHISEAHIVGVPSRKYGEEVMAWIRTRPEASLEVAELQKYCQSRMASFKVPKYWQMVEAFPQTVTGKVQKYRLREMAIELLGKEGEREATA
ncbi:MAG TPA: AMP-binding protein [Gemmatales bacterium]|nr:AMP-binding protein [Gemmatales bacterium]